MTYLTTEDTGFYAGTWHDLPDGTRRYYTLDHVAHMRKLGRGSHSNGGTARIIKRFRAENPQSAYNAKYSKAMRAA